MTLVLYGDGQNTDSQSMDNPNGLLYNGKNKLQGTANENAASILAAFII